jgi:hypothetical protein
MIDRLELTIPEHTPKVANLWQSHRYRPCSVGSPYQYAVDFRADLALTVHCGHRHAIRQARRHYKLDFTDTRLMSVHDLLWRICSLFDISHDEALTARVVRIDFTADVYGTPIFWFKENARVLRKSRTSSYETILAETKKGVTALVFGKRPDLIRIYNRIAEKRERGEDVLYSGMASGAPAPVVTRIERQCSGIKIPAQLARLGQFFANTEDFDPFVNLVLAETGAEPGTDDWKPHRWLMNLGLQAAVQQLGKAAVLSRLNKAGNGYRYFQQYAGFLRATGRGPTREDLRNSYRSSTILQFNQPRTDQDGQLTYPAGGMVLTL